METNRPASKTSAYKANSASQAITGRKPTFKRVARPTTSRKGYTKGISSAIA